MFGRRIDLFTLFGFPVRIDLSWFLILTLITWTLAAIYFPAVLPGLGAQTYWVMGLIGALGLFVSIILHEMAHSMVARRHGLPIEGITLFIFGGVSEMLEEPRDAMSELLMAIAGPISSFVIAGVFFALGFAGGQIGVPVTVIAIFGYLAVINLILAIFNLLPAFPLDGGRAFRSILWKWKGNINWATRIASRIGSGFGTFLVILGVFDIFAGFFLGGFWWILIGLFLRWSANSSYRQFQVQQALEGEPVSRFMHTNPVTVHPKTTIQDLVQDYFYKYYYKTYPVVEDGHLRGCISLEVVKKFPQDQWSQRTVRDLLEACPAVTTVTPDTDAKQALNMMSQSGASKLMVTEDDRLVGVLSMKDLMDMLSIKGELKEKAA